jgi:hypothetical protein
MKTYLELFVEEFGAETKPREGYNSRHICPKCKMNSLSCHVHKGAVRCFHCNWATWIKGGKESETYEETPIDRELQIKVTHTLLNESDLSESHRSYLTKRGIYNPELYQIKTVPIQAERILLKYFTKDELVAAGFFYKNEDHYAPRAVLKQRRILIPHWQGDKIIAVKSRLRPFADPTENKEPKYASPHGANVGKNLWWKGKMGRDMIVTEGELCAIATCQSGITACGLPGVSAAQNSQVIQQTKQLIADSQSKRIFIILDTDEDTKNDPAMIRHSLTLRSHLGKDSVIIYLPLDYDNEPMDLDLFLSRYDIDDLYNLMEDSWTKREGIYKALTARVKRLNERRS